MSNMEAFNTITAQIQKELSEDSIKALKEALVQTEEKLITVADIEKILKFKERNP